MSEETPQSLIFRFKRPLLLAAVGVATVTAGVGAGLWFTTETPDRDEGNHTDTKETIDRDKFESVLTNDEVESVAMPAAWDETATEADRIANHVKIGDNALRIGDYAKAISLYRMLLPHASGTAEASIRFRLALSAECSGALEEALRQYQAIAQKFSQSNWNDVAQYGRVRCLARTGGTAVLDSVVYRNVILDDTALTPVIRQEVLHSASRGLCKLLLKQRHKDILAPDTLLLSAWQAEPNRELQRLPGLLAGSPAVAGDTEFQMLQKIDDNPDYIYFSIHTRQASIRTLMNHLADHAGLKLRISETAVETLVSRKQAVHANDVRMSLLLDGLCVPFGLAWYINESTITVLTADEQSAEQEAAFFLARTERLLESAHVDAADSPQASHTTIAHACLLFESGRIADAAHSFSGLLQSGFTPEIDIDAAFNLGKCYQALKAFEDAEQAWYRCVDAGGKDRITRTAAYICLAKLQLEDARFRKATQTLEMAMAQAVGSPLEQHATVLLGSAYLLAGNGPAANTAMFKHRQSLEDKVVSRAVAFTAAVARFRTAALAERRENEARDVVATLSHFDPTKVFGAHWHVVAAEACEELGLTERAVEHYIDAVEHLNDGGLRKIAMMKLAEQYRNDRRLSEAGNILQAVSSNDHDALSHEIGLQKADLDLQKGQVVSVIDQCRRIASQSDDQAVRRRALHLMGRAFEKQEDHESAVYCFAGMLPQSLTTQAVHPAGHKGLK